MRIRNREFKTFLIAYDEKDKLENLTDYEFELICAYEFYAQTPTGQYDEICCCAIKRQLFDCGIYLNEHEESYL